VKVGRAEPGRGSSGPETALTHGLEVEGYHLAASVPEHLGHVIGRVHAGALGVNAAHLALVVAVREYRSLTKTTCTRRTQQSTQEALPPAPTPQPGPLVSAASRILHKLHRGLREQVIGLELREGRDDVTSVLLCARGKGTGNPYQTVLPFGTAPSITEIPPT
jgi:hypothetical protein